MFQNKRGGSIRKSKRGKHRGQQKETEWGKGAGGGTHFKRNSNRERKSAVDEGKMLQITEEKT